MTQSSQLRHRRRSDKKTSQVGLDVINRSRIQLTLTHYRPWKLRGGGGTVEMTQSRLISIVVVTFFIKIMEDADEFLVVCLSEAEIFTSSLQ